MILQRPARQVTPGLEVTDNPAKPLDHAAAQSESHLLDPCIAAHGSFAASQHVMWQEGKCILAQPFYQMPEGQAAALRRLKENRECSEQAASVDPCLQAASEAGAASGVHAAMPESRTVCFNHDLCHAAAGSEEQIPVQTVLVPVWRCNVCQVECVPVRACMAMALRML